MRQPATRIKLHLNGSPLSIVTNHRFLGVYLDSKLTFATHNTHIISSCRPRLAMLRHLTSTTWGSSANTILLLFKSLILSKILYASEALAYASSQRIYDLDKLQSAAIRIALGVGMRAPITSLRAEAALPPVHLQHQLRLEQLLIRIAFLDPYHRIFSTLLNNLNGSLYATTIQKLIRAGLIRFAAPPTITPFWTQSSITIIDDISYLLRRKLFPRSSLCSISELWILGRSSEFYIIFTDGSFCIETSRGGAAFFDSNTGFSGTFHLSSCISSTEAELAAITEALRYVKTIHPAQVLLLSDSSAAISSCQQHPDVWITSPTLTEISNLVQDLSLLGTHVFLSWIPAHVGIRGNETADSLARSALESGTNFPTHSSRPSLRKVLKIHNNTRTIATLHNLYLDDHPRLRYQHDLSSTPPRHYDVNREVETLYHRLKIGVANTQNNLSLYYPAETNVCALCDTATDSSQHLLLFCPVTEPHRIKLFAELALLGFPQPMNIRHLLARESNTRMHTLKMKAIFKFAYSVPRPFRL